MKSQNPAFIAYLTLLAASMIWGANGPVMKITLQSVPLFSLAFIRFGTAALLLYLFLKPKLGIKQKDIPLVIFTGLMGIVFNISLYFWGLRLTTALNAGIIEAALPLLTLFFLWFFIKAQIAKNLLLGGLIGLIGIIVILSGDFDGMPHLSLLGDFLILSSSLAFMFYEMMLKKLFTTYSPLTLTFYAFAIGAVIFLPSAVFELYKYPFWYKSLPASGLFGMFYGILLSSLVAHICWQWGLSKIPIAKVGFFLYVQPIISTTVAVIFLSEKITSPFLIGSVLIFAGLFLAESHIHHHPHVSTKLLSKQSKHTKSSSA